MEKRAFLAVMLSIAFIYAYSAFFQPKKPVVATADKVPAQAQLSSVRPVASAQALASAVKAPAAKDEEVSVDTPVYSAVFSTRGASLKRLVLKNYRETADPRGKNVSLVNESSPDEFTLATKAGGFGADQAALYVPSTQSLSVSGGENKQLSFVWTSPAGVTITKTFTFHGGKYGINLDYRVANTGAAPATGVIQTMMTFPFPPQGKESRFDIHGPVSFAQEKLLTEKVKDLATQQKNYQAPEWSGYADKYFLSAMVTVNGSISSVAIGSTPRGYFDSIFSSPAISLPAGEARTLAYRLYFGPKDLEILKAQGNNLERAIDLGWFAVLAKPLLHTLKFFYRYTGNYGLAIIIITVIIKILFYPLTHASYKSMKEMQKLQPKMNQLREKYKNDREAMNKAMMELYQTHKVNPLGGCLPMIVQIPVFFALYKALMYSIELRHAPFFFWIQDLSAKDPYYVTPIIMGVTMVIQQKMTPSQMDPTQQKMMMALPVVFTFMFLNFPSGLVLYWLVNNILTITQQYFINKSISS
ncbi:membrane protein insertase YidC [Geotalea uraniireducens]|uniref:Membrane protein insertase YidC n=1 Tax=Geotalea uraniireducens TaxID=351604 RepID=A0ABM8EGJ6_9BACT|nr:membrane protein insertase YidC [Geotalea uraniireducens]BDV41081.1 membrane protein insertase YidC [Geotalea uraniireducens]